MTTPIEHEWVLAPFKVRGDTLPNKIREEISRATTPEMISRLAPPTGKFSMGTGTGRFSSRQAAKAVSFGMTYGSSPKKMGLGKRWQCTRCRVVHYSEETPAFMEAVRIKSEEGPWFEMPLVPCKYSYMPTFGSQPFGTCDEEMVKWVMES